MLHFVSNDIKVTFKMKPATCHLLASTQFCFRTNMLHNKLTKFAIKCHSWLTQINTDFSKSKNAISKRIFERNYIWQTILWQESQCKQKKKYFYTANKIQTVLFKNVITHANCSCFTLVHNSPATYQMSYTSLHVSNHLLEW